MENDLSLEKIVQLVTREVIREMERRGTVPLQTPSGQTAAPDPMTSVRIDMRSYKTPIVTEHALNRLHERTAMVIIPAGAIITPRARELIREKKLKVIYE